MNPFGMTKQQIQEMGPVQSIPKQPEPGQLEAQIKQQIERLRDMAALADVPIFVSHVDKRRTVAMKQLLEASSDEERRDKQAEAKVWMSLYRDAVTAKEQVRQLGQRLEELKTAKV